MHSQISSYSRTLGMGSSSRNFFLVTLFVLIVVHGGDVVHSAALNKFPSVQFVTDNSIHNSHNPQPSELHLRSHGGHTDDDYYKSVPGIDKQSIEHDTNGIISDDIFWGPRVESAYPQGHTPAQYQEWQQYVASNGTRIVDLEQDKDKCGRMQNRLVHFGDGSMACGRYRQNIDQIQGELFSFYLGRLLQLRNMAPTALQVVDEDQRFWANASSAVQEAGWKAQRPVVLTRHIPGLIPSGIPTTFQKLERHLNKFDVTLGLDGMKNSLFEGQEEESDEEETEQVQPVDGSSSSSGSSNHITGRASREGDAAVGVGNLLSDRATVSSASKIWPSINWFNIKSSGDAHPVHPKSMPPLSKLIELAQWSDLVVFDYLIAHLDRVVNNLYNYQWNSEIMEAPAHNLAKDPHSGLLVFLDNESGLLHGYRLLHKYQAYHSLLLQNLCIFRRSTIDQLRWLAEQDVGKLLNGMLPEHLHGALPQLPDKSVLILKKRIGQVLRHVEKCRKMTRSGKQHQDLF